MDLYVTRTKSYGQTFSSNAIAAAAGNAGLAPNVDSASDVQKWLRTNEKGIEFISKTSEHSCAGPMSVFVTGILGDKKLRHYDVNRRGGGGTSRRFIDRYAKNYKPVGNEVLFDTIAAQFETISGTLNNATGGYGSTNGQYDLSKGFSKVGSSMANALGGVLNMASSMMGSQRASTMGFKSDNTHDNYNDAKVQNLTGKALYSNQAKIAARYPRAAQLLDFVYLEPHSIALADGLIYPFVGNYFVSEITTRMDQTELSKEYTCEPPGALERMQDSISHGEQVNVSRQEAGSAVGEVLI
jgi:hypothetical protein